MQTFTIFLQQILLFTINKNKTYNNILKYKDTNKNVNSNNNLLVYIKAKKLTQNI